MFEAKATKIGPSQKIAWCKKTHLFHSKQYLLILQDGVDTLYTTNFFGKIIQNKIKHKKIVHGYK